jgi:hypothetical protein
MNPAEILRLQAFAAKLSPKSTHAPEAFMITFVAWEALKIRILLVGMTASGLTVRESRELITLSTIWQRDGYGKLFMKYFGKHPHNAPVIGQLFRSADSFQKLRNGFIHGGKSSSPDVFRKATLQISNVIDADWESLLTSLLGPEIQTDPFGTLRRQKRAVL